MATLAERLAELQTELVAIKAAQLQSLGGASSMSADGVTVTYSSPAVLREERTRVEKSIQRLLRGGRGMPVDMSQAANGSGSEVLL